MSFKGQAKLDKNDATHGQANSIGMPTKSKQNEELTHVSVNIGCTCLGSLVSTTTNKKNCTCQWTAQVAKASQGSIVVAGIWLLVSNGRKMKHA